MANIKLRKISKCESGATGVEYGLLAALLSVAIMGSVSSLAGESGKSFFTIAKAIAWGGSEDGLVGNGDFRVDNSGPVMQVLGHLTRVETLEGWTSNIDNIEVKPSGIQASTSTGGSWIDMTSEKEENLELATQLVLVPDKTYNLDFEVAHYLPLRDPNNDSSVLEVYFGGDLVGKYDTASAASNDFEKQNITLVGGSGNASNELVFKEVGYDGDYGGVGLGNIAVTEKDP